MSSVQGFDVLPWQLIFVFTANFNLCFWTFEFCPVIQVRCLPLQHDTLYYCVLRIEKPQIVCAETSVVGMHEKWSYHIDSNHFMIGTSSSEVCKVHSWGGWK